MKVTKVPPLKCKDCASTKVIHDYTTITCDECGLVDGKGKQLDQWKQVNPVEVKGTRQAYKWVLDEDDDI